MPTCGTHLGQRQLRQTGQPKVRNSSCRTPHKRYLLSGWMV